jgi:FkbM family methyltransferase
MKCHRGIWLPSGELHLARWMDEANRLVDGKPTYQYAKLEAALGWVRNWRVAVDVGAHCGLWSMHLVKRFSEVHAFEPVQAHRECLMRNVPGAEAADTKLRLHACALGERAASVSMRADASSSGDSWVCGEGPIPMETLDRHALRDVDLIKLDCAGYELPVLRGAEETLKRCRPCIIVEQKPGRARRFGLPEAGAVAYLQRLGAKLREVVSGDYIFSWDQPKAVTGRFTVYASPRRNSSKIGQHLAKGTRLPYREVPCKLRSGGMVSYGAGYGLWPLLERARREGREWVYLDNGYFLAGHFDGYYRVTRNAYQHDGSGNARPRRFARLGLKVRPWRSGGSFVLVCPPSPGFGADRGIDTSDWLPSTLSTLRRHTDREIRVREKPPGRGRSGMPLEAVLRGCHALVTDQSNAAVLALLAGVPVFCTSRCAAYRMGHADLSKIETPRLPPDREQWAWNLAANQWMLREMASGQCWRELMG